MSSTIYAKFAAAKQNFKPIPKNRKVKVFTKKGEYEFSYADIEQILASVEPSLVEQGLVCSWRTGMQPDGIVQVTCYLREIEGGGELDASLSWPINSDIQGLGSIVTYLKRYTIQALLGVVAEDDDDGNAAAGNHVAPVTPANKAKTEAAIAKGQQQRDQEQTTFSHLVQELGWTLDELRNRLVKTKRVSDIAKIAAHPSEWPRWAKVQARELCEQSLSGEQLQPAAPPAPPKTQATVPNITEDEIPF